MDSRGFLDAERRATELVDALSALKEQVKSYSSAHSALDGVRARLEAMIESTEDLVNEGRDVIAVVGSIGGPEIDRQLQITQRQLAQYEAASAKTNEVLKSGITHITEGLTVLLDRSTQVQKTLAGLKTIGYLAATLSAAATVIGIVILNGLR